MYGIVNASAQEVLPCKYIINNFEKEYAKISRNNKFGLINQQGEIIIPWMYDKKETINENLLREKNNDKWG